MTQQDPRATLFSRAFTAVLLTVVGQVGCLTVVVLVAALALGLYLDRMLGTRAVFTVLALLGSMPLTIGLMLAVVRRATARLQSTDSNPSEEDAA